MKLKNVIISCLSFLMVVSLSSCNSIAKRKDYGTETQSLQVKLDSNTKLKDFLAVNENKDIVITETIKTKAVSSNTNVLGRLTKKSKATISLDNETNSVLEKRIAKTKEVNIVQQSSAFYYPQNGVKKKENAETKYITIFENSKGYLIDLMKYSVVNSTPSGASAYENMENSINELIKNYWFNGLENVSKAYENNDTYTFVSEITRMTGGSLYEGFEFEKIGETVTQLSFGKKEIIMIKEQKVNYDSAYSNVKIHIEIHEINITNIKIKEVNQKKYKLSDYITQ